MPVRTDLQITGVKEAGFAGKRMADHDGRRLKNGLVEGSRLIFDMSQILVPRDKGDLAASGKRQVTGQGSFASVEVFYGGPDAPHAWVVHENTLAYHEPPTQAKYLSHAVDLVRSQIRDAIRREFLSKTLPIDKGQR